MFLHEIEPGQKVFIDANIFVYHFSQGSRFNKSCTDFLYRVEASEVHGITSTAVVQETTHRLMMVEASAKAEVDVKNLPKYLKQHPDIVKQLTQHLLVEVNDPNTLGQVLARESLNKFKDLIQKQKLCS